MQTKESRDYDALRLAKFEELKSLKEIEKKVMLELKEISRSARFTCGKCKRTSIIDFNLKENNCCFCYKEKKE